MHIIANENVSTTEIEQLRMAGHDVLSVKESMQGQGDRAILARAQKEHRLVVTHDKDFGELAFRFGLPASCGVILLRLSGDNPYSDSRRTITALGSRADWSGHFAVITENRIRMRPLPCQRPEGRDSPEG